MRCRVFFRVTVRLSQLQHGRAAAEEKSGVAREAGCLGVLSVSDAAAPTRARGQRQRQRARRRRLPVVMVRLKMSETLREAVTFIEQGHVRVGPETVTDPAFMVTRVLEDFVTWTDSSKIRRKIQSYHNMVDDYDLL